MSRNRRWRGAFALYEVLLGLAIFAAGVIALGRSVQNCINASGLSSQEDRVRQILANRMAEIQATPDIPDRSKEIKIATGYGDVRLIQTSGPAGLKGKKNTELTEIKLVTLKAEWTRGGRAQSRKIDFYVYRNG
jgi:Tfp pilus assembly protein PilV